MVNFNLSLFPPVYGWQRQKKPRWGGQTFQTLRRNTSVPWLLLRQFRKNDEYLRQVPRKRIVRMLTEAAVAEQHEQWVVGMSLKLVTVIGVILALAVAWPCIAHVLYTRAPDVPVWGILIGSVLGHLLIGGLWTWTFFRWFPAGLRGAVGLGTFSWSTEGLRLSFGLLGIVLLELSGQVGWLERLGWLLVAIAVLSIVLVVVQTPIAVFIALYQRFLLRAHAEALMLLLLARATFNAHLLAKSRDKAVLANLLDQVSDAATYAEFYSGCVCGKGAELRAQVEQDSSRVAAALRELRPLIVSRTDYALSDVMRQLDANLLALASGRWGHLSRVDPPVQPSERPGVVALLRAFVTGSLPLLFIVVAIRFGILDQGPERKWAVLITGAIFLISILSHLDPALVGRLRSNAAMVGSLDPLSIFLKAHPLPAKNGSR